MSASVKYTSNIPLVSQTLQDNNILCFTQEPMSKHTTFKIGGPAALFCVPQNIEQLQFVLTTIKENNVNYYIVGNGSNLLFCDKGFGGVIIHISRALGNISVNDTYITAEAGADLSAVCLSAMQQSLSGLEFAYGIPGSVGGAVFMNAGAYGGEIKDVLTDILYINDNAEICTLPASQANLGYRQSIFQEKPWIILAATFKLKKAEKEKINADMQEHMNSRRTKQPLDMPSAGSAFKRPVGAFASALIDQCGLRGYSIGGAAISEKHCGFIVNIGNATSENVLALAEYVSHIVHEKTGYTLEKEIRLVNYNGEENTLNGE